jgi:hypothetical protein
MAFSLGSVFIQIGANNAPLQRDLRRTESILKGFGNTAARVAGPLAAAFSVGAIIQDSVRTITNFEQAVANLSSITGKSAGEMDKLTASAIQIGRVSSFTATQVVELQTELAKLGFTEGEILKSTRAIGDFSVAVGTDAASAAALGGAALRSFGLDASKAEEVMNTLAVATTKSALDFSKLQTALPYVGTAAQQMGLSIERTTAILGLLSDRGVRAETAGTSLRDILLDSAKSGLTFEESIARVTNSQDKLKTATDIFGKTSAGAAVIIAENSTQLNRLQASITGADGALKEMTDKRLDTAKGKLELLTSAWEGFVLSVDQGDGIFSRAAKSALGILTDFVDDLQVLNESGIAGLEAKALKANNERIKRNQIAALPNVGTTRGTAFGKTFQDELKGAQLVLDNLTKKLENTKTGTAEFKQLQEDIAFSQKRVNDLTGQYTGILDQSEKSLKKLGETGKKVKKELPELSFKVSGNIDIPQDAILRNLDLELAKITELGKIDINADVAGQQINVLTDALRSLVSEGVDVADPKIRQLQSQIKSLTPEAGTAVFTELETNLKRISQLSAIGLDSDPINSQISAISTALENLIAAGVDPASQKFIELQTNLNNLKAPNLDAIFNQVQESLKKADVKIRVGLETDTTSEKISILENALTGLVDKGLEGTSTFAALQTQLSALRGEAAAAGQQLGEITIGLGDVFSSVGENLGNIFSGDAGAAGFFGGILTIVGDFTVSLGKQMIAIGAAGLALKKTFTNPAAAIIAGIAMVAIGGAIKNKFAKGIPSLDIGTRRVQSDGLALIHKGEEIKPARVVGGGNYDRNTGSGRSVSVIRGNDLYLIGEQTAMLRKRMAG